MTGERVAVVLGNYVTPRGKADLLARRRVEAAVMLLREGKVDRILFSGGLNKQAIWKGKHKTEAAAMKEYALVLMGNFVPKNPDWAMMETKSQSTVENAKRSAEMLTPVQPSKVYIVTTEPHDKRSVQLFRENGFEKWPLEAVGAKIQARNIREMPAAFIWNLLTRGRERRRTQRKGR